MRVDVHAHCYPKPYMEALRRIGVPDEGGIGTKIPAWTEAEATLDVMDALGVDIQVLSLSAPNVYFEDPELSLALAQMTNDFFSDVCKKHPDRFLVLASVPLNHMKHAVDELHRALNELGMDGVVVGTNINGRSVSEDQFLPFFEEVNALRIPVTVHPMRAIGEDLMPEEDRRLAIPPNVGFIFETTRSLAQMTFKGTFERLKNLTFVLPHSGGAIPFIYSRWDMGYAVRPSSHPLRKLLHPPSHYLRRHYYDTAQSFRPSMLRCTMELAGLEHIVFGTDAPYTTLDLRAEKTIENIENGGFAEEEKESIYYRNAMKLYPRIKNRLSHL